MIEAHFEPEPVPQPATYTYNYLGQRASKTVGVSPNQVTTYFIYDVHGCASVAGAGCAGATDEVGNLLSEIDSNGDSIKDYVYAEGELVAWVEQTGNTPIGETLEQVFYPLNDHLGQPFMVVRGEMDLSHEQYTDPFGKLHAAYVNNLGTGPEDVNQRFPGQYYDQETGLHQNWNREYDPMGGRYYQPDPIGLNGGMNPYLYANANPVNWVDVYGLSSLKYDSSSNKIHLYDKNGKEVGSDTAHNNTTSDSRGPVGKGTYQFSWWSKPSATDDKNSDRGSNGNFIFEIDDCDGCGVHSGREENGGTKAKTNGCIRTTDEMTKLIRDTNEVDGLKTLTVE